MNKLLKLYAYKKIEGLVNAFNDYDQKIIKPQFGKEFLQRLLLNMTSRSQYNYADRMESTNKPKTTKFGFKKKIIKKENIY